MDCFDSVYDNYYVVLLPTGRAVWAVILGVVLWHLHSVFRPARVGRRFGLNTLDVTASSLVRVLVARNCALAVAALFLFASIRPKPQILVLYLIAYSCLVDAVAVSRARGVMRALDLWTLAFVFGISGTWIGMIAEQECIELLNNL